MATATGRGTLQWTPSPLDQTPQGAQGTQGAQGARAERREGSGSRGGNARLSRLSPSWLPLGLGRASGGGGSASADAMPRYAFFVSYFREEAGCIGRFLQTALQEQLQRPVFLDASDADVLDEIVAHGVARAECVLLLQTAGVLTRPWVLLELFEAVRRKLPVVPVCVAGGGYDFETARSFLHDLERQLDAANPGAVEAVRSRLAARGERFSTLQRALSSTVPGIISVPFHPDGSDNHVAAVVRDIADKSARARRHSRPGLRELLGRLPSTASRASLRRHASTPCSALASSLVHVSLNTPRAVLVGELARSTDLADHPPPPPPLPLQHDGAHRHPIAHRHDHGVQMPTVASSGELPVTYEDGVGAFLQGH